MYPIAFHIGRLTVRMYGVMAALGFLAGCFLVTKLRKYARMNADQASISLFVAMAAGIIGARVFYVIQFFEYYRDDLWKIFRIDQGGLVFYGGFLFAIGALILYCRRTKLDFVRVLDVYTPAIAVAHACGRIGCFFNGCCYGKPTTLPWGVNYPAGSDAAQHFNGAALHPVQLYEAGEELILFWLYLYLLRRGKRGMAMSAYLAIYGVLRFCNELMRGDHLRTLVLTQAQFIGLALIPIGILLFIYFARHGQQTSDIQH